MTLKNHIRMYEAALSCSSEQKKAIVVGLTQYTNKLRELCLILLRAANGKHGEYYKKLVGFLLDCNGQNKEYLSHAFSLDTRQWKSGAAEKCKRRLDKETCFEVLGENCWQTCKQKMQTGNFLYKKSKMFPKDKYSRVLIHACITNAFHIVSSYRQLLGQWKIDHDNWLNDKDAWERTHIDYMHFFRSLDQFEHKYGYFPGKRFYRDGRYSKLLANNIAWRNREIPLVGKSTDALKELIKNNPEIKELHNQHVAYIEKFAFSRKDKNRKRNVDGYYHPPTFTLPDMKNHYYGIMLNSPTTQPSGYDDLDIYSGKVTVVGLARDPMVLTFQSKRLLKIKVKEVQKQEKKNGKTSTKTIYSVYDSASETWFDATIAGIRIQYKLSFRNALYLQFSVNLLSEKTKNLVVLKKQDKNGIYYKGNIPEECIFAAVDLGLRNFCWMNIYRNKNLIRAQAFKPPVNVPTIDSITKIDNLISSKTAQIGKRSKKGDKGCKRLRYHLKKMKDIFVKEYTSQLLKMLINNNVNVLLIEDLQTLQGSYKFKRSRNRKISNFLFGKVREMLESQCTLYNVQVVVAPPYYTSQVCSACGGFGFRFFERGNEKSNSATGSRFKCGYCGKEMDADYNACGNIYKRFIFGKGALQGALKLKSRENRNKKAEQLFNEFCGSAICG